MSPGTLSKSGFPPFHRKCAAIENTVSTSVIQRHCPDFCFSPTLLLRYWFKMSAQWKCQRTPYYRNRLDPPPPREPVWSVDHTLKTSALVWAKKDDYGHSDIWLFANRESEFNVVDTCFSFPVPVNARSAIKRRTNTSGLRSHLDSNFSSITPGRRVWWLTWVAKGWQYLTHGRHTENMW